MLRAKWLASVVVLSTFLLSASTLSASVVVINEVMAANYTVNADAQGEYDDWIELHNSGATPVDLSGMFLTDDLDEPTAWPIPAGTVLGAGGYLLIWADNDVTDTGLHASFELDATGEQVALFDVDGVTLLDAVEFGDQSPDVSFGRDPDGADDWMTLSATPGASNYGKFLPVVADTTFSHDRGFYDAPIEVTLSTETEGATIHYTTDGSTPTTQHGTVYREPILIFETTSLRAMAFKLGWKSTNVDTQTYIFLDQVIGQATNPSTGAQITPAGYPTSWGSVTGDYQMDPDVIGQNGKDDYARLYANTIRDDLQAVPSFVLVMDKDDWFGNRGIYINQSQDGTERVASMEVIDPQAGDSFQINCAIAMQGGVSGGGTSLGRWKTFKLSMRPRFKPRLDDGTLTGGPGKLDHRLFDDSPIERFNTVVLDAVLNHSWLHPGSDQRNTAKYIQDQYIADLHNAMGGHSPHGSYAHVYINNLYWGMYYIHERPDHAWAAQLFGGEEDEYDAIKHNSGGVINSGLGGNATSNYNAMVSAAGAVASNPDSLTAYAALSELLDVDDFITYLLATWYTGNHDWPHKNWYATHRNIADGRWRFHSWDAEHVLEGGNDVGESPSDLHSRLAQNAEYRLRFADLIHRYMFNDGPLTPLAAAERYRARMDQACQALVGESARWGDNRQSRPYTVQDWEDTQTQLLTSFFPSRTSQVLSRLRNAGLYPNVDAPEFQVNGQAQHGGHMAATDLLSLFPLNGDVYYTLDGSDPRTPGAAEPPSEEFPLVSEDAAKKVLVPTGAIDAAWRSATDFDDATWVSGTGGIGYERSSGYESLIDIDLLDQMNGLNASCYIRIPFSPTPDELIDASGLKLKVRYDDGFVAYLNGTEVTRRNFDGEPAWNSSASQTHSDTDAVNFETIDITADISQLRLGQNVLAIQGLNSGTTSSDFLISAELVSTQGGGGGETPSGVAPTAQRYSRALVLTASTQIKARALNGNTWSALSEATFAVGPVAESLRISEVMYHPAGDPNAEYIELTNVGSATVNLNLVRFANGVDFTFPSTPLAPGEFVLVVRDVTAFTARYGDGLPVAGTYSGSLDNAGERLELLDAAGQTISTFRFKDNWVDLTDGQGFSLTVVDPAADVSLDDKSAWRASAIVDGSPGFDDSDAAIAPGAVVINELMAYPADGGDWIELYNTSGQTLDLSGWFLSDDDGNLMKYEIAAGTTLAPGGYLVLTQDDHFGNDANPGCHTPFGLSRDGETVYLHSGAAGLLTGYSAQERFGACDMGVAQGRYRKSTEALNFVALDGPTPGAFNAGPKVGPVVITEIMYNPAGSSDAEYVELLNISDAPVILYEEQSGVPWRFTDDPDDPSIELLFPIFDPVTLVPGQRLLLVKSTIAFELAYGAAPDVPVLEWGGGKLANGGDKIELGRPAEDADPNGPWVRVDRVVYSDGTNGDDFATGFDPWPTAADGFGQSLGRLDSADYGNDPANWQAITPSPGLAD